jgi:hypothetical protein
MDTRKLLPTLAFVLIAAIAPEDRTHTSNPPALTEYVCLDTAVKGESANGRGTIFALSQMRPGECESVVMPSPLFQADRDLLYAMRADASNVEALYEADEIRVASNEERTWAPMIAQGVANFRRMRGQFCSRHPDMFVYDLKDDGERASPRACVE